MRCLMRLACNPYRTPLLGCLRGRWVSFRLFGGVHENFVTLATLVRHYAVTLVDATFSSIAFRMKSCTDSSFANRATIALY